MTEKYILAGKTPVPCPDLITWGKWMQAADRKVALTLLGTTHRVSTVFLGLDHKFSASGDPVLFETMVFKNGSYADLDCNRCSTYSEAVKMHTNMVRRWKRKLRKDAK